MAEGKQAASDPKPEPFEFSDVQKESFRALSTSMSVLGVFLMLLGGLSAVFALGALYEGFAVNGVVIGVYAVVLMLMASWLLGGGRSLSAMMRTRGRDVDYLMETVGQLRRYFGLTLILLMVGMMATIAAVVFCVVSNGKCFGLLS
jgi:hypothetical protein